MNRRQALTTLSGAIPGISLAAGSTPSRKKGWAGGIARFHELFGAHWYYTWAPKTRPSMKTEFVPMIKGEGNLKQADAIRKMNGISHLLGFNEPERAKQGNVSLDRAIELWPQLVNLAKAKNLKLGSPAPSSDGGGMKWFHAFMKRAEKEKLHIDFIAMHWYRSKNARDFESFIEDLAKEYDLPVWVTEFNGWSGEERDHYKFLKDSLRFLEKSRHVERYAYFNPPAGKEHSLLTADGKLTRMGELYRDAGT